MDIYTQTIKVGDQEVILETGRYGEQCNAAVTARHGDTVVLATVVMGRPNPGLGYFPLSVEYQEKLYAGGRIKGSRWVKREGRPSDEAILKARLIDRSIRPLFPKGLVSEIQVIVTILSADGVNDADMAAMYAVSAALSASDIPWEGPIAAVRVGLNPETQQFSLNPTFEQRQQSDLDLVISGTQAAVVMVEAGANEVPEAKMVEAFDLAQKETARLADEIATFAQKAGKAKIALEPKTIDPEIVTVVQKHLKGKEESLVKAIASLEKGVESQVVNEIIAANPEFDSRQVADIIFDSLKAASRHMTFKTKIRPDGRKLTEIRPLLSEVGVLPRTHGSAMFKRGATQALSITTLGSPSLNQLIENMEGEEEKRYIHHYFMPPFTVGETGRIGWPSRREIGHGALAERALEPVIPAEADFPYTIRVVSELMSSNGSTSMASVCGSTLSLMDAGVPIKKPVAGIAMGLLVEGDEHLILSDIQGLEDHTGDMDFKVAGTQDGITAMQMDIKVAGIPLDVIKTALSQAREGRLFILEHMLKTLSSPRSQLSDFAPKIEVITIPTDRIGEIIGPGGRVIRGIIADSGAQVDIEEDGRCFISSQDNEAIAKARNTIEGILKEVEPGEEYEGKVTRIETFGAFVDILPGKSGLVHVSQLSPDYVRDAHDVVKLDDIVKVTVTDIDNMGRINLTMLTPEQAAQRKSERGERGNNSHGRNGGNHRSGGRGGFNGGRAPYRR